MLWCSQADIKCAAKLLLNCSQTGVTAWLSGCCSVIWLWYCSALDVALVRLMLQRSAVRLILQCSPADVAVQSDVAVQFDWCCSAVQLLLQHSLMLQCSLTGVAMQPDWCCHTVWLMLPCSLSDVAIQSDWCFCAVWLMLPYSLTDVAVQSDWCCSAVWLMLQCSQPDVAVLSDGCCRAVRWMLQYCQMLCSVVRWLWYSAVRWRLMLPCCWTDVAMSSDWCCHVLRLMLPCCQSDVAMSSVWCCHVHVVSQDPSMPQSRMTFDTETVVKRSESDWQTVSEHSPTELFWAREQNCHFCYGACFVWVDRRWVSYGISTSHIPLAAQDHLRMYQALKHFPPKHEWPNCNSDAGWQLWTQRIQPLVV